IQPEAFSNISSLTTLFLTQCFRQEDWHLPGN
ncbi:MAG: hypothetical protein ACI8RD_007739, partial [Bacillariaceae sp.]